MMAIVFNHFDYFYFMGNGRMKQAISHGFVANSESFSIATQIYVRLRRVTGRVVDAIYLAENPSYARHVIQLALATQDEELARYVDRLTAVMQLSSDHAFSEQTAAAPSTAYDTEPSPEEIYQAQVSHHYIGALR